MLASFDISDKMIIEKIQKSGAKYRPLNRD